MSLVSEEEQILFLVNIAHTDEFIASIDYSWSRKFTHKGKFIQTYFFLTIPQIS